MMCRTCLANIWPSSGAYYYHYTCLSYLVTCLINTDQFNTLLVLHMMDIICTEHGRLVLHVTFYQYITEHHAQVANAPVSY